MEILEMLGALLVLMLIWMTLAWWIGLKWDLAFLDVAWSYGFIPGTLTLIWAAEASEPRSWLFFAMISLWSLRLGTYLLKTRTVAKKPDKRYEKLKEDWGERLKIYYFRFCHLQGLSIVFLLGAFLPLFLDAESKLGLWQYLGAALFLLSISMEALADHQLHRFVSDPDNKGKVCDVGLWNYSRHPNYFFEFMIWVSWAVYVLPSPQGYLSFLSPLVIFVLITKVTGIPPAEASSLKSKGERYREYQKTTSAFVPWFKKRSM